jgi:hypothetical protein
MKTSRTFVLSAASVLSLLAASLPAQAIPLPDSSQPTACTSGPCFSINNTASGGTAIRGFADGSNSAAINAQSFSGNAVRAQSQGGDAIRAAAGEGIGVNGSSGGNHGVKGQTNGSSSAGVFGQSLSGSGGVGVLGEAFGSGSGVFGRNNDSAGFAGNFQGKVFSSGGYFPSSDARLKKDIQGATYGLGQLLQLRPVTYHWKDGSSDRRLQLGFIAQEVQKVLPELVSGDDKVTGDPSKMLTLNYDGLLPVVVKAVQEQQGLIQSQQKLISALESRIASLERRSAPVASSLIFGGVTGGLALLLPVGLVLGRRRRKSPPA